MIQRHEFPGFSITIYYGSEPIEYETDNVDVEVSLPNGRRYSATCCPTENIRDLMESYRESGENSSGLYFWASDLVVVRDIAPTTLVEVVSSLIAAQQLSVVFTALDDNDEVEV
jgi:hypothetical protein